MAAKQCNRRCASFPLPEISSLRLFFFRLRSTGNVGNLLQEAHTHTFCVVSLRVGGIALADRSNHKQTALHEPVNLRKFPFHWQSWPAVPITTVYEVKKTKFLKAIVCQKIENAPIIFAFFRIL